MSRFLLCGLLFASLPALPAAQGAEPQRWVLSSASENRRTETFHLDGSKLTPQQPNWRVHLQTLHGGSQEGCELLVVDNGRLRITLIPTRGMSVLVVVAGDLRLGWKSPVAEVVHTRENNLQSRGGLGWLEGFNE